MCIRDRRDSAVVSTQRPQDIQPLLEHLPVPAQLRSQPYQLSAGEQAFQHLTSLLPALRRNTCLLYTSIASLIILVFFVPYVASGLAAIGKLFNSLFGWNYMLSVIVGAIVIISYTSVGGFSAVALSLIHISAS